MMGIAAGNVNAQWNWNPDPTINTPVCTASNTTTKTGVVSVPDGAGGTYIAWEDTRTTATTATDIYLQHLDANGNRLLAAAGLPICTADSNQTNIVMIPDGIGGVVIAWQDNRASVTFGDIYVQKVNAAGTIQWAANGLPVINTTANQVVPAITPVSLTEFVVVWRDGRNGTLDLYSNKFSLLNGAKLWLNDVEIVNQPNTQQRQQLFPDQVGGFFCVWEDPRISTTETDIFLQRVDNAGAIMWAANGVNICNAAFNQLSPQLTGDGSTGVVAVWGDNRVSASDQNIYAQRVDNTGAVQWTANGVAVCTTTGNQTNPLIVPVGLGNTILTWSDNRVSVSDRNIYTQKLDNMGVPQWTANGVAICTAALNQPNAVSSLTMVPDNSNGAIITWDDNRANNTTTGLDIYAQKISSAGAVAWAANGVPIATRTGSNQRTTSIVPDNANGAIIAWLDARSGSANAEIHASHLFPNGTIPVSFSSIGAQYTGTHVKVYWVVSTEINAARYELEKSSDGRSFSGFGTVAARNSAAGAGYDYTDVQPFAGIGYYRIAGIDRDGRKQYSSIVKVNMEDKTKQSLTLFPQPAREVVTVRMDNATAGYHYLTLSDAAGRILQQQKIISSGGGSMQSSLRLSHLSAGSYILQWKDAAGRLVQVQQLQHQ